MRVDAEMLLKKDRSDFPDTDINSIGMEFILIPAGEFEMGSLADETNWYKNKNLFIK